MNFILPAGVKLFVIALFSVLTTLHFKIELPFWLFLIIGLGISLVHRRTRWIGLSIVVLGICLLSTGNIEVLEGFTYFSSTHVELKDVLNKVLESREAIGLVFDLSVADKSLLPETFKDLMYNAGIAHLIAVSGMHVGIIFMVLDQLLKRVLPISMRYRYLLILVFVLLYGGLAGFTIPVIRAILMILVYVISKLFWDKIDTINVLFLSASIIVIVLPSQLLSWSFQFSFLGVFAIVMGFRLFSFNTSSKVFNYLLNSFLAGFYAQLLIVPLLVFYLKVYSLYSLFLGFSLAPVFVVLLCVIPILLLSQLAQVSVLVEFLVALIHKLCLLTMKLPYSVVHFQNFTWKHLVCTYLIICSLTIFLKYRRLKYLKWTSVGLGMILLQ